MNSANQDISLNRCAVESNGFSPEKKIKSANLHTYVTTFLKKITLLDFGKLYEITPLDYTILFSNLLKIQMRV